MNKKFIGIVVRCNETFASITKMKVENFKNQPINDQHQLTKADEQELRLTCRDSWFLMEHIAILLTNLYYHLIVRILFYVTALNYCTGDDLMPRIFIKYISFFFKTFPKSLKLFSFSIISSSSNIFIKNNR